MKIKRLLLHAFGPFSEKEIDLSAPTNENAGLLHLIYGPNEAGKSSALRAMGDLRFGIHARSADNFIHDYKKLRIAAEFIDSNGQAVCLIRRKGRGKTLAMFDRETGEEIEGLDVSREHQLALTDGLDKSKFESMFGLNHERLRKGGQSLLKGEGELGSALFEASTGTRGINDMIKELDDEARDYFSPRASTSLIMAAKNEWNEQKKIYNQALSRPKAWKDLNNAHEEAKEYLNTIDQNLEKKRRRNNELIELRTVAPLLQAYDHALYIVESLQDAPNIPQDSREKRLAAEQAITHAEQAIETAESELHHCQEGLNHLTIEVILLKHDDTIERLAANIESVQRSHIEALKQAAAIQQHKKTLLERVKRISSEQSIDQMLATKPSDADALELNEHLDAIARLSEKHKGLEERIEDFGETEKPQIKHEILSSDPVTRQALQQTLKEAQALGDISQQKSNVLREIRELEKKLARSLTDLNARSDHELRIRKVMMESQINEVQNKQRDINTAIRTLKDEDERLLNDLEEQKNKQRQLKAGGQMVTFDSLQDARKNRDKTWALICQTYIEPISDAFQQGADQTLPKYFELTQQKSDEQADLLRADAKRATLFEASLARMERINKRHAMIVERLTLHFNKKKRLDLTWKEQLIEAKLPLLPPEALREWQMARDSSLDIADQLTEKKRNHDVFLKNEHKAVSGLGIALQAVNIKISSSPPLSQLMEQATLWEKSATENDAKRNADAKNAKEREAEYKKISAQYETISHELDGHKRTVQNWCPRLFLNDNSGVETIKKRLLELDSIYRDDLSLRDSELRLEQSQAIRADFEKQASELANLLGEPKPDIAADFASCLRKRLLNTRQQEQKRITLEESQQAFNISKLKAEDEAVKQTIVLKKLCKAAAVDQPAKLPDQEERATQKREAQHNVETQKRMLQQASNHPEKDLRERLLGQDIFSIDTEKKECGENIARLEKERVTARQREETTRIALEAIDASDKAAAAQEAMESAAAKYREAIQPWARLKIAHKLLQSALNTFKKRAQAPMVASASKYFAIITDQRYIRLMADESEKVPVLVAEREDGKTIRVEAMSAGTADQLYLALRLASLELRSSTNSQMPLILDDVLMTSDDQRSKNTLKALVKFAQSGQVILFTHHQHLINLAKSTLPKHELMVHEL
ncbi:MAG: AAA family ATPase [Mariprofundaceae bacterium]|nr:AAA family ATPase [Mariprofundaceae bacterium]